MSLFKTREFWNTKCGSDEEFDQYSIHVTNIDNASDGSDKIIVGSHSGILRIYGLRSSKLSTNQLNVEELSYDENDILVEMQFPQPILQVKSGILLSASDKRQLLILFPKKIGVYSVSSSEGLSEYGFAYSITSLYEHELQRTAFCVTIGSFGMVKGRDFVCVQSLDGCLMFFEQETSSFIRTMPNSLLPTSFAYLPTTDTFFIQSADWILQCFRYQMLAISAHQDDKNSNNLRKVAPDWSFELGEPVLEIETVCLDSSASLIVVLGERNLFVLRSDGTMYWQKKFFDFKPIYCHSYCADKGQVTADSIGNNSAKKPISSSSQRTSITKNSMIDQKQTQIERDLVILLITEMSTLLIYNDSKLKWACQLPELYCQVQRANFYFTDVCEPLIGCLTCLSSSGHLALAYLGTHPSSSIVNNTQSSLMNRRAQQHSSKSTGKSAKQQNTFTSEDKEQLFTNTQMDKDEFDRELNDLRKIINAYNSDFSSLIKLNSGSQDGAIETEENDLTVELVNMKFDTSNDRQPIKLDKNSSTSNIIDLVFNVEANKQITNLIINLNTSNGFNVTPNLHSILKLETNYENNFQFRIFYDSINKLISFRCNQIYLIINYLTEKNLPRIYSKTIELPMSLFLGLQNQSIFNSSRTGSSTNPSSHNSSTSQRSVKFVDRAQNQIDKNLEQSLDHYLTDNIPIKQSNNTISFHFISKKSVINLSALLQEIMNNKSKKNEENSISNKASIQFWNAKLKLVDVEFIQPSVDEKVDDSDQLLSHKSGGYRVIVIGDDIHSNCFMANLLINKLCQLHRERLIDKLLFQKSSIPIREYFELIDRHLKLRLQLSARKKKLEEYCEQLRVVEKRILVKLKDRNISNLNNLESLLNMQHQKIMSLVNEILQLEVEFVEESVRLNCCNQLICSILKCVADTDEEESALIEGSFNILPFVQANDLGEWQERTEQSLGFLLRHHLKDSLDISKISSNFELIQPEDCGNLFKLIRTVIDKCFAGSLFNQRTYSIANNKTSLVERILEVEEN